MQPVFRGPRHGGIALLGALSTLLALFLLLAPFLPFTGLTVGTGNQPPAWNGPEELSLDPLGPTMVDLAASASDPEGAPLTFTVSVPEGLAAEVRGTLLILTPREGFGSGELTLIISDGSQLTRVMLQATADRERHLVRDDAGTLLGSRTQDDPLLDLSADFLSRASGSITLVLSLPPPAIGVPEGTPAVQNILPVVTTGAPVQLSADEIRDGHPVRLTVPLVQGILPRVEVIIGSERFVFGKVVPVVHFAGTAALSDRPDGKLDLLLSQDGATAAFRGLRDEDSVTAAVIDLLLANLTTPVFAAEPLQFDNATLTLPSAGNTTAILECPSFDLASQACPGSWRPAGVPFTDNGSTATFTVTHFSGYAGASGDIGIQDISACGDISTGGLHTLDNDVSSTATCFTIKTENVTLNCQGFTINYSSTSTGHAINATGLRNITVTDCRILQTSSSVSGADAIKLASVNESALRNISLITTGPSSTGIVLLSSINGVVANATLNTSGSSAFGLLLNATTNATLANSTVATLGQIGRAVFLTSSSRSILDNNTLLTNGSEATGYHLVASTFGRIHGSFVQTRGPTAEPIHMEAGSDQNIINATELRAGDPGSSWMVVIASAGNNMSGLAFAAPNASILFQQNRTIPDNIDISRSRLNLSFNRLFLNASALDFLNITGRITFRNLTFGNAMAFHDLDDNDDFGPFSACDNCTPIGYEGTVLTFDAIRFSTYISNESALNCGWISNASVTLSVDLTAAATCFTFISHNVSLDCAGRTIRYALNASGSGLAAAQRQNLTIRNCRVVLGANRGDSYALNFTNATRAVIANSTFNTTASAVATPSHAAVFVGTNSLYTLIENSTFTAGTASDAISWDDVSNSTIRNNTILTAGSDGISADNSDYNSILNNSVEGATADGIRLTAGFFNRAVGNIIANNSVNATSEGIEVSDGTTEEGPGNIVERNLIRAPGSGGTGIRITGPGGGSFGANQTARENDITAGDTGIDVAVSRFTQLHNNRITMTGTSTSARGFLLAAQSQNITGNNITLSVPSGGIGIFEQGSGSEGGKSSIIGNRITGRNATGIQINEHEDNNISHNFINVTGLASDADAGLKFSRGTTGFVENNTVFNNTFIISGAGTAAFRHDYNGFFTTGPPNIIERNNLSASGAGSLGIHLDDAANDTFINNTILAAGDAAMLVTLPSRVVLHDQILPLFQFSLIYGNASASINYTATVNVTGERRLEDVISIRDTRIRVTTTTEPDLNASALLHFTDTPILNVSAAVDDEDDDTYIICGSPRCTTPLAGGSRAFSFNVSQFTGYTLEDPECGGLNTSKTLTRNITASGGCFNVTQDNITLDCAGFTINYSNSFRGGAVSIEHRTNVTITNCSITEGFTQGFSPAIRLQNATNVIIRDTNVTGTANQSHGVLINASTNATLLRSRAFQTANQPSFNAGSLAGTAAVHIINGTGHSLLTSVANASGTNTTAGLIIRNASDVLINASHLIGNETAAAYIDAGADRIRFIAATLEANLSFLATNGTLLVNLTNTSFNRADGAIMLFNATVPSNANVTIGLLNITFNRIFLNATALTFLNDTAQAHLRGISFTDPRPTVDLNDTGAFEACDPPRCTEVSFNASGTFIYNVTGFTAYSSEEGLCGTVTADTTLSADVQSAGTCITFGADNIIYSCGGRSINYSASQPGNAFYATGRRNITIRDCLLRQATNTISDSAAILLLGTNVTVVTNTTIRAFGSDSHGIAANHSLNLTIGDLNAHANGSQADAIHAFNLTLANITNATLTANRTGSTALALYFASFITVRASNINFTGGFWGNATVLTNADNITYDRVTTRTPGVSSTTPGIEALNVTRLLVENSTLEGLGTAVVLTRVQNSTFRHTLINGTGIATGLSMTSSARITHDNATMDGSSAASITSSNATVIENSTILGQVSLLSTNAFRMAHTRLADSSTVISVNTGNNLTIFNNTFTIASTAVSFSNGVSNSTVESNAINATGTGILVDNAQNVTVMNNEVNATGSSPIGIEVGGRTGNTTVTGNTVRVTSLSTTTDGNGIYIDDNTPNAVDTPKDTVIADNRIRAINSSGIELEGTHRLIVRNNSINVTQRGTGIRLSVDTSGGAVSADNVTITNITIHTGGNLTEGMLVRNRAERNITLSFISFNATGPTPTGLNISFTNNTRLHNLTFSANYTITLINNDSNTVINATLLPAFPVALRHSNRFGAINFTQNITITDPFNTTRGIRITNRTAFANTTAFPFLNTTAHINFFLLAMVNPRPTADFEDDGIFADCDPPTCTETGFNATAERYAFNVSHFTAYGAAETAAVCGSQVTRNAVLESNINGTGLCITIIEDNVTLDCQGFRLNYSTAATGNAIKANDRRNITIANCNIVQTNATVTGAAAINLTNVNDTTIRNSTIRTAAADAMAVRTESGRDIRIQNLTINTTGSASYGVQLRSSQNVTIENVSADTANDFAFALFFNASPQVSAWGGLLTTAGSNSRGVFALASANVTLENLTVVTTGGTAHGVHLDTSPSSRGRGLNIRVAAATGDAYRLESGSGPANLTDSELDATGSYTLTITSTGGMLRNVSFNATNGSIRFTQNATLATDVDIDTTKLNITFNRTYLNTTALTFLNTTARVTIRSLTGFLGAIPVADFNDTGLYARCPASICTGQAFSGGTFAFDVTHFTAYAAQASGCGTLNASMTLAENLSTNSTCFTFGTNNITLDCDGHTIFYVNESAIVARDRSNITVRNCNIIDVNESYAFGIAINLTGTTNSTLFNNTIQTNGTNHSYGILLQSSSSRNTVHANTIRTLGFSNNTGIFLTGTSTLNTVANNTIAVQGNSTNNPGIHLFGSASNNITNNTISANASNANETIGIKLESSSTNIRITNNTIRVESNGSSNFGIWATSTSDGANITFNLVNHTGRATSAAIRMDANDALIANNTVITGPSARVNVTTGSTTQGIRLHIVTGATIRGNTLLVNSSAGSHRAVQMDASSSIIAAYNNFTLLGSSPFAFFLNLTTSSTIANNTIRADNTSTGTNVALTLRASSSSILFTGNHIHLNVSGGSTSEAVQLSQSSSNNISGNHINLSQIGSNAQTGIRITINTGGINSNTIANNNVTVLSPITTRGITIHPDPLASGSASGNIIRNNRVTVATQSPATGDSGARGIRVLAENTPTATSNIIDNNTVTAINGGFGIHLQSADSTVVENNTINVTGSGNISGGSLGSGGTGAAGIFIDRFGNNIPVGNVIRRNNITVSSQGNRLIGAHLEADDSTVLADNAILTNGTLDNHGIKIFASRGAVIARNNATLLGFHSFGILHLHSNSTSIDANTLFPTSDGLIIEPLDRILTSFTTNNVTTSNTINGVPVSYYGGAGSSPACPNDTVLTAPAAAHISIIGCSGITLANFTSHDAITLVNTVNATIINSTTNHSHYGIRLLQRTNASLVANNTLFTNGTNGTFAILLWNASGNIITNNTLLPNGLADDHHGILLVNASNSNRITTNRITAPRAIIISASANTTVANHTLAGSPLLGIAASESPSALLENISVNGSAAGINSTNSPTSRLASIAVTNASTGILLSNFSNGTLTNSTVVNASATAISVIRGANSTLVNVTVRNASTGLSLSSNENGTFTNITLAGASQNALALSASSGNTFAGINATGGNSNGTATLTTQFDNDSDIDIIDTAAISSAINVSGFNATITGIRVSLHLNHTFDGDLRINITGPDGTMANLSIGRGGGGDNFGSDCAAGSRTTFDDSAATAISAGSAPFVGSFIPDSALSAFSGKSGSAVNGLWALGISDTADGDNGTLFCWSLLLDYPVPADTPAVLLDSSSSHNRFMNSSAGSTGGALRIEDSSTNNSFTNMTLAAGGTWLSALSAGANNTLADASFTAPNGTIRILPLVTLPSTVIANHSHLNISFNRTFLNSTNLTFLNTTARIILHGISLSDPAPFADFEDDGTFAACGSSCIEESFAGGIFTFNTTRFTSYTAQDNVTPPACGSITAGTTLVNNITANGTCISIGADDITLDCDGFAIIGNGTGFGYNATARRGAHIRDCTIIGFEKGIVYAASNASTAQNNTVLNTTTAIDVTDESASTVNITLAGNRLANSTAGIQVRGTGTGNITVLRTNITSDAIEGIILNATGGNITLSNNTVNASPVTHRLLNERRATINLTIAPSLFIIEETTSIGARINYTAALDLTNQTAINDAVSFSSGTVPFTPLPMQQVRVNTTLTPQLNRTARIELFGGLLGTLTDPFPLIDLEDNGTFDLCPPAICTELGYTSVPAIIAFSVAHFTNYSVTEAQPNLTLNKTANQTTGLNGTTILFIVNLTNLGPGNATDIYVRDLDPNATFVNSTPAPVNSTTNDTWTATLLGVGQSLIINITVRLHSNLTNGTVVVNYKNVTYNDSRFRNFKEKNTTATVTAINDTAVAPTPPPPEVTPEPEPEPSLPAAVEESGGSSLRRGDTPFTCGYQVNGTNESLVQLSRVTQVGPGIPAGYEAIESFRAAGCTGQSFDITFSIPDHYKDIRAFRCGNAGCQRIIDEEVRSTAVCAGTPLEQLRRDELIQRRVVRSEELEPVLGRGQVITPTDRSIRTDVYSVEFTGPIPVRFPARLGSPHEDLPRPVNPALTLIGTPLQVELDDPPDVQLPAMLQLPVPRASVEPGSAAVYVLVQGCWLPIGGTTEAGIITASIDDLRPFLVDGRAIFGVLGIACFACTRGVLKPVYEPEGIRNAVVLIHGFGASPRTWQPFIDEAVGTRQPFQVWVYGYPFTQPTDTSARELADQLQVQSGRYDRLYLVGHSLGGIIMEKALAAAHADPGQYGFLGKARAAISVGAPHDGVPLIRVLEQFAGSLAEAPTAYAAFNPRAAAAQELQQPFSIPRVEGIPYYVVAGTRPLATTSNLFAEPNDGVTTVRGAQRIGDALVQDTCRDFFPVPLTHPELNDEANARRLVARLIARDIAREDPGAALLGYNQYARIKVGSCSPDETYVIAGVRIPEEAAAQPLGCGCGNGVCGVDETEESCPSDCGRFVSKANVCFGLAIIGYALLIALIVLTTIHLAAAMAGKPEFGLAFHAVQLGLLALGLAAFAVQLTTCQYIAIPAYVLLLAAAGLFLADVIRRKGHLHPHTWEPAFMERAFLRHLEAARGIVRHALRRRRK